jgi:hypothetical protein
MERRDRATFSVVKDALVTAGLFLGLATLITAHVALSGRLVLRQRPRWRGVVAFWVPPLAVIWGFQAGYVKLAVTWLVALGVYVASLLLASVGG